MAAAHRKFAGESGFRATGLGLARFLVLEQAQMMGNSISWTMTGIGQRPKLSMAYGGRFSTVTMDTELERRKKKKTYPNCFLTLPPRPSTRNR